MKIAIVYIYPLNGQGHHGERAFRFLETYHKFPPMLPHDTVVICNGGKADDETRFLFDSLPNVRLIEHDDSGYDIGGFQLAAQQHACDLMVFFGGNSYFRRAAWMLRMVDAYKNHGDTLYGATGNTGHMAVGVYPHIRTTGFWCSPHLINRHPFRVTQQGSHGERYEYEHGARGLTTWVLNQGKMAWVTAWDGEYTIHAANSIPNGFRAGDQSNVLVGDRLTQVPYGPDP